jgi:hypothetical protein
MAGQAPALEMESPTALAGLDSVRTPVSRVTRRMRRPFYAAGGRGLSLTRLVELSPIAGSGSLPEPAPQRARRGP